MQLLKDVLAENEFLREILPKLSPEEMRERDRAEAMARFGEKYPNAIYPNLFLLYLKRIDREDAPCKNCKGYPCAKGNGNEGWKGQVYLDEYSGEMSIRWVHCKHKIQADLQKRIDKQFKTAQIPNIYAGKTFDDYIVTKENENAVKWAKYILDNPKSLYLYGAPGAGKTFLAAIIAQEYLKRGKAVIFSDVPSILNQLRKTFYKKSEDSVADLLETLEKAEVLVLDDIGTEGATKWAVQQVYLMIDSRYRNEKLTILTSNYNLDEMAERLNNVTDGPPDIMGRRIASRLVQMCARVNFGNVDWRNKK